MVRHKKTGWYEHFCLLIFAQGTWVNRDRESVHGSILKRRKELEIKDDLYHLYLKLTRQDKKDIYQGSCHLCKLLYEMFEEIKGNNDGILFQGHHYLILEDDINEMKDLANLIIGHEKVKKFYLLYLDGLRDFKTTEIKRLNLDELKDELMQIQYKISDFFKMLERNEFKNRTIYEITKNRYM